MSNYFDCKYLTLVGHVQSGKTNEEISYIVKYNNISINIEKKKYYKKLQK